MKNYSNYKVNYKNIYNEKLGKIRRITKILIVLFILTLPVYFYGGYKLIERFGK